MSICRRPEATLDPSGRTIVGPLTELLATGTIRAVTSTKAGPAKVGTAHPASTTARATTRIAPTSLQRTRRVTGPNVAAGSDRLEPVPRRSRRLRRDPRGSYRAVRVRDRQETALQRVDSMTVAESRQDSR